MFFVNSLYHLQPKEVKNPIQAMSCESPNCNTWLCNKTCLPKRFVMGSEFFCCIECKI